jgi:hypothetical protein
MVERMCSMKRVVVTTFFLILSVVLPITGTSQSARTIIASKVVQAPIIDGIDTDPAWAKAQEIITHDKVADIDITLKAVYTDKDIFFLVIFPDPDESRSHKSWVWDKGRKLYNVGNDREDSFVFKWNMGSKPVDLSIYAVNSYKADIWFWKACRTDSVGYADDKIHSLSPLYTKDSTKLTSRTGTTMYLLRKGDSGSAAYKTKLPVEYEGDVLPRFTNQTPSGSRADVKAKGIWKDGKWTIEFRRMRNTGNNDDVQFDLKKSYYFGVSRYEIAGRKVNKRLTQPLYGSGDISEVLTLIFAK